MKTGLTYRILKRGPVLLLSVFLLQASCNWSAKEKKADNNSKNESEYSSAAENLIPYTGDSLRNIAFPLGGIGTGNLLNLFE